MGAQTREELSARIDSLLPVLRVAEKRADVADSLKIVETMKRDSPPTREIEVGPLTVVAVEGQAELARSVLGEVWAGFAPFVGDGGSAFEDEIFTFHVYRHFRPNGYGVYVSAPGKRIRRVEIKALYGRERLREKAASLIAEVLNQRLDPEMKSWGRLEPPWGLQGDDWIYRRLVTSPAIPARECFEGRIDACWEAVGVVEAGEDLWDRWYTPLARLNRARRAKLSEIEPENRELWSRCVRERLDEACRTFLEQEEGGPEPPLSRAVRSSLLMFALQEGGEGAYERLLESRGTMRERLARAAGMDPDAVMRGWRERVLAARPEPQGTSGRSRTAALAWLALFGFLATRSTRWRSG